MLPLVIFLTSYRDGSTKADTFRACFWRHAAIVGEFLTCSAWMKAATHADPDALSNGTRPITYLAGLCLVMNTVNPVKPIRRLVSPSV